MNGPATGIETAAASDPVDRPAEPTTPTTPTTMSQAECYQRLRAHLAFLKLTDAAEALPRILDAAREQNLPPVSTLERLLAVEVAATEDPG